MTIGTEVTLSTATSGAAIYYTDDNSYPTTGSAIEYSVPIQITENVTIKAVAVDATGVLESSDVPVDGLEITGPVGTEIAYEVKATKEGLKDSETIKVTYIIKETSTIADPVTDDMFIDKDININEAITTTSGDVSVIGQLAYRYGNYDSVNTSVIQDIINGEIVAIQTFNSLDGFSIGDVVRIKGKAGAYGGVPQISNPTVELIKSANETVQIPAQEFEDINNVISNKETLLSEVILLKDVTLGAYNSNGNTTITDKKGGTLDIYRAATYPEGVTEGEVVDLLAILSKYTTTNQLRVGSPSANGGSQIYNVVNDTKAPVITLPTSYLDAQKGVEYKIEVDVTDNKGILKVTINYTMGDKDVVKEMTKNEVTGRYEYTILAAEMVFGNTSFTFTVEAEDVSGHKAQSPLTIIKISDAPRVVSVSPASGSSTHDNKKPEIYAMLENGGSAPTATLTLKNSSNHAILDAVTMTVLGNKAAYTPDKLGFITLTVKVSATLGGTPYDFEETKEFEVLDPNEIVPIAIDGGHSNFYITGNYPDSDAGLIEMANRSGVRIVRLKQGELTTENLKDKKLLILTVPFVSFETSVGKFLYTDAEIQAIKEYADNGDADTPGKDNDDKPDNSDDDTPGNSNDDKGSGGSSSGSNSGSRTPQPTVLKNVKVFNEVLEITAEVKAKDGAAEMASVYRHLVEFIVEQ